MAISLTINNKTFVIPSPGEDPGWGADTTDWIKEANAVISSLFGPGDILQSSFNIANNVGNILDPLDTGNPGQNILGLSFNPSIVRAAEIQYSLYRESDVNPSGNTETGSIRLSYDNGTFGDTIQSTNTGSTITITTDNSTLSLKAGDKVTISGSDASPSINGDHIVSNVTPTSFDITPSNPVVSAGTAVGSWVRKPSWQITQDYDGDAGVTFDIDETTGQIVYASTDIDATGYSGVMKFRAKALVQ